MNPLQNTKFVKLLQAQEESSEPATTAVDTAGYNYATILILIGEIGATFEDLKLQHSDEAASNFSDITGANFNGSTTIDAATAALPGGSDDGKMYVIEVDLRNKKRYLDLVADPGAGDTGLAAVCILSQAANSVQTATERGAAAILRV